SRVNEDAQPSNKILPMACKLKDITKRFIFLPTRYLRLDQLIFHILKRKFYGRHTCFVGFYPL
ncbi:MAG TPA: hypothetical protein DEQ42_14350, partial [Shigella sp.]|nr:hypothetical protein [Shigella sp.]